jgi:hypothetical protein
MNCHEWQAHWQALLDGDAAGDGDADWRAHWKDCPACRELSDAAERLWISLRQAPQPVPPPLFLENVLSAVRREQHVHRRRRLWMGVGICLAAALVVFGIVRLFFPAEPGQRIAATSPAVPPPPSLESELADARSATVDFSRRVAQDTMRQAALFLPPADRWPAFGTGVAADETTTMQVREMGRTVSSSLEPVTSSTRRAFDMFRRLLPPTEIDKPNS